MILQEKCNVFTVAVGLIITVCNYQPVQSKPRMYVGEMMQKDTAIADTIKSIPLHASISIQDSIQKSTRVITNLPEALVVDQMRCLEAAIPMTYNKTIKGFINYYLTRDRRLISQMLHRKHAYFPLYEELLLKHSLPDELKYLSIVESNLNPRAVSSARAAGLWQFMSATGRQYKLYQDAYIDERLDPYKATEAACKYLKDLHGMFGDWQLALAAYNCGPGNVRRAIRRSGNKTGFWQIYSFLPRETRAYVPKFIAINYLMQHAQDYNITAASLAEHVVADTIVVSQHVNMETLAQQLEIPLEELRILNPQVKKNIVPGYMKNYSLRIPQEKKEHFTLNRENILASAAKINRTSSGYMMVDNRITAETDKVKVVYKIKSGDVLSKIAAKYHVRVTDIQRWNHLKSNTIKVGQVLVIWRPGKPAQKAVLSASIDQRMQASEEMLTARLVLISPIKIYFVQQGDTLSRISQIHGGITVEKIKKMNRLYNNEVVPGQKLIIG